MRLAIAIALVLVSLGDAAEVAQQPTVPVTPEKSSQQQADDQAPDPRDNRTPALTPDEEMQRQIRLFDPLDRSGQDPNGDRRIRPGQGSSPPGGRPRPNGPVVGEDQDSGSSNAPASLTDKPLPGSLAASREENTVGFGPKVSSEGPEVSGDATPRGEYTGPAVLSRSYTVNRLSLPGDTKWHEAFSYVENYDTGTTRPLPGFAPDGGAMGAQLTWTFAAQEVKRHDQFGFNYNGNYSQYTGSRKYSGSNNSISLSWTHLLSRRLTISNLVDGQVLSSSYTLQNPTALAGASLADLNLGLNPNIQPTDSGTKQINLQTTLAWQQSARLSWTFGAGYFGMIRSGAGLIGATGTQAQAGVNYRYSRKQTVGLFYSNGHNQFPHGIGATDTNSFGFTYSTAIGRSLQMRARVGLSQTESLAQSQVPLAPIIVALTGRAFGIIDAYRGTSSGDFSVQVLKDLNRNLTGFFAFTRGISPGNGLLLTSTQQSISFGTTARLLRHYMLGFTGSSDSLSSVSQVISNSFQAESAVITLSRQYKAGFAVNVTANYRYFGTQNPTILPNQLHFSSGITWSPPAGKIWPF